MSWDGLSRSETYTKRQPAPKKSSWEYISKEMNHQVRRLKVSGGYLYQTSMAGGDNLVSMKAYNTEVVIWSQPIFVAKEKPNK